MDRQRHRRTLTEDAAQQIRRWILDGTFALGAPLSENTLAARLGYSKTPIREALLQLKKEGLVTIRPQCGSFVFELSQAEADELGDLREVLETAALARAMRHDPAGLAGDLRASVERMQTALLSGDHGAYRREDAAFHRALFTRAGNRYLEECHETYAQRIVALGSRLTVGSHETGRTYGEHDRIAGEVAAGKADAATDTLKLHIRMTTLLLSGALETDDPAWGPGTGSSPPDLGAPRSA